MFARRGAKPPTERDATPGGELEENGRLDKKRPDTFACARQRARVNLAWLEEDRRTEPADRSDPPAPVATPGGADEDSIPIAVERGREPTVAHADDFDAWQARRPYEAGARALMPRRRRASCGTRTPAAVSLLSVGHRDRRPPLQDTCRTTGFPNKIGSSDRMNEAPSES